MNIIRRLLTKITDKLEEERIERGGETQVNEFGSFIMITEYRNAFDVDVYFPEYNCVTEHITYKQFLKGKVHCQKEKETLLESKRKIRCVELDMTFDSVKDAADYMDKHEGYHYSGNIGCIHACALDNRDMHCCYHWEYID